MLADPTEHHEISAQHPDIVAKLRTRLEAVEATLLSDTLHKRPFGAWISDTVLLEQDE